MIRIVFASGHRVAQEESTTGGKLQTGAAAEADKCSERPLSGSHTKMR